VTITRTGEAIIDDVTGDTLEGQVVLLQTQGAVRYRGPSVKKNVTVAGKTVDVFTGESLPFAVISVNGTTNGTTSNADGYFTLLNVPTDTAVLEVSYLGYAQRKVYLSPNMDTRNFIVELLPAQNTMEEVLVTANKEDMMQISTEN